MKDKKLQVFVSSTYIDLREERQAAVEAILSSGNIPAGMELFSAGDESQMTVIERWIDESDVYLLILGGRYGSVEKKSGKSYTHWEYEYALSKGKPLFAVVISEKALDEKVKIEGRMVIEQENPAGLKEFRTIVLQNLVKFWDDKKDIKIAIHETLADFTYRKELIGWIRGDNAVNAVLLAEEIARLTKENSELILKISNSEQNSNILYATLTYTEMKKLLINEADNTPNEYGNLFNFLLKAGERLALGTQKPQNYEINLNKLVIHKLARRTLNNGNLRFEFTNDGHNFYLKALSDK